MAPRLTLLTQSESETLAEGERLGRDLGPGDTVLMYGALGSGKTVMARGIAIGLGVPPEDVRSPSFTLINPYRGRFNVYHVDLYRIEKPEDLDELGLEEILEGDGVAIVEWAERLAFLRPRRCLEITLTSGGGNERQISVDDRR